MRISNILPPTPNSPVNRTVADRIPSYYDIPTADYQQVKNVPSFGERGPLLSIRKKLGLRGSASAGDEDRVTLTWEQYEGTGSPVAEGGSEEIQPTVTQMSRTFGGSQSSSGKLPSMNFIRRWKTKFQERKLHHEDPGGLSRVVQRSHLKFKDERMKTYVIVEVFEGHQIIKNWNCGDLVHYVNRLGAQTATQAKKRVVKRAVSERSPDPSPEHAVRPGAESPDRATNVHHHHHHHYHHFGTRRPVQLGLQQPSYRSPTSQLTYRDLRQVFTDGAPVPSIEVRRHCLVICLPPLSCLIMRDRVFLLVVEDLNTDRLVSSLEEMQLRRMGKHAELEKRLEKRSRSSLGDIGSQHGKKPNGNGWNEDNELMIGPQGSLLAELTEMHCHVIRREVSSPLKTGAVRKEDEKADGLPMEFEAIELLICGAFELLDSDISHLERTYLAAADNLVRPTSVGGEELHLLKNQAGFYNDRVALFDKAFEDLISNGEEMVRMELSRDTTSTYVRGSLSISSSEAALENEEVEEPNPDLEILLEFFDQELEMFRQRLRGLLAKLDSTERLISLKLSLSRNSILRWEIGSTMVAAVIGTGTLVSGLFGMNLRSDLEDSKIAFICVSLAIACFSVLATLVVSIIVETTRL